MKIIEPRVEILSLLDPSILVAIERAGRTCYKSEREFTFDTARKFTKMLVSRGHESVVEHSSVSVKFIVDRAISHEIVRHRVGTSYSQESTRYCSYNKEKFGGELTFIQPFGLEGEDFSLWSIIMEQVEEDYLRLVNNGVKPEWARSILPNSLKTELVCTFTLRAWRHFFQLRCMPEAHPQMRQVALALYHEFLYQVPELVEDIVIPEEAYEGIPFAEVSFNLWNQE